MWAAVACIGEAWKGHAPALWRPASWASTFAARSDSRTDSLICSASLTVIFVDEALDRVPPFNADLMRPGEPGSREGLRPGTSSEV